MIILQIVYFNLVYLYSASKLLMQFSIDSGLNKSITENVAFWTQEDAGKNQHILNEAAVLCQRCESYLRWFSSQKNHIFTSMQLKFKNIVMKNTNPKKRIYNKATKQHPKFKQKEDDEDDGNLDGVQQRNVLLETKWLEQSLSEMSRIQLASGDLSISMQELAATYVALEDRVLQFGITSALNRYKFQKRLNKLHYILVVIDVTIESFVVDFFL